MLPQHYKTYTLTRTQRVKVVLTESALRRHYLRPVNFKHQPQGKIQTERKIEVRT